MNNRSHYSSSSRSMIPHPPLNLPSIHLLFQIADSPAASPQPSSLTLPPLRMSQAYHDHRPFYSTSPTGSSSSTSSTRASSTSTASSSPQSQEYSRPTKRKQVKRACQNCQKVHDFILRSTSFSMGAPLHQVRRNAKHLSASVFNGVVLYSFRLAKDVPTLDRARDV
ncbi:hypothetical protein Pst134EA_000091 [Puccinia striiformis f. sp. tritici]|uniref:hypothetical protein n=1 Tax=Puccinia striiformis f. sp. tritici TaxID=168172 RepID=UPI0020082BDC|nr:hypothetical protein Pst134EA_000091 [Puccinia striiformis f. sp. tritici]KAH9466232.1 hypothetical protein Pst134EB_001291 [Puccinia striiformis f. sp. tritici]KAH9473009.1 hypothetical protein Pst134EA_000091 [Puccinia striiformis f. sp. tritici]